MEGIEVLRRLAAGNYHHPDGLRALHIGVVTNIMMEWLLRDMRELTRGWEPSIVREGSHNTGWTRPVGQVKQWSLYSTHGRTNDTSDDFRYDNLADKRPVSLSGIEELAESLPDLVNMRLNLIGPGSRLSPHEESLERDLGAGRVALRARFHLPLVTTGQALMLADGDLFHFEAGRVYLFNNGCVHSASNDGDSDRLHLVWDQLMTERAVGAMFGSTPPIWLGQSLGPVPVVDTVRVDTWERQSELSEGEFYGRSLTINLISRDNGVGLSADMALLETLFTGHSVARVDWRAHAMRRCDVAIFLELWNPRLVRYAKKTVGVFNLEWFQSSWTRDLRRIHQLWAKSEEAYKIYQGMGLRTATLTGFASRDLNDLGVERTLSALHLRGHSDFKNTPAVIEAWRANPDLPPLTIISSVPLEVPSHVRLLGRISEADLRKEMNKAIIHVCPSRAEGWGHYITEALGVGGIVITTNASPMNEHVHPDWGVLIPPAHSGKHGMVRTHSVTAEQVAAAVHKVARMPE
jgi:Aspartyl/Asparaginyl beta-hydroxylase/Glycosyl transferases group 1